MTERVRIEHTFDCSEKAFWDTFLRPEYNKAMFCERMRFPKWDIIEFKEDGPKISRVVQVQPYIPDMPAAIKKVLGDNVGYREEGVLDRDKNSYKLKVVPTRLADKIFVAGEQYTQRIDDEHCRRIFEASIEVKIFGIGGLIEKNIASDMKKSYDVGAAFTSKYMRDHGLA